MILIVVMKMPKIAKRKNNAQEKVNEKRWHRQ